MRRVSRKAAPICTHWEIEQHLAALDAVGNHAADQGKQKNGDTAEEGIEAEQEGRVGKLEDEPALGGNLHPRANAGGAGAYPHQAEVAILKSFEDPANHDWVIFGKANLPGGMNWIVAVRRGASCELPCSILAASDHTFGTEKGRAMLPDYLAKAKPNPMGNRAPWYANTAPTYAGIFLWIAFYQQMAGGTLQHGGLALCLVALAVAGLLSYALYYRVPAMLGMKTGFPLYVVGSSTFGTAGGYVMPGLLMGVLQIGWFAVGTFFSADYILRGLGMESKPGTLPFAIVCVLWGGTMAFAGAKGVQYVSKIALFLNAIPLLMLLVVFFQTSGGIGNYQVAPAQQNSFGAFTTMIAIVIGFFATAGAAGADFGMNARE